MVGGPGAQAHLASLGFSKDRQLSAKGETNEGTRYEGKLVGDSPELMPLDNQLFSYFEHSMKQHVAVTRDMLIGHAKRFGLGRAPAGSNPGRPPRPHPPTAAPCSV